MSFRNPRPRNVIGMIIFGEFMSPCLEVTLSGSCSPLGNETASLLTGDGLKTRRLARLTLEVQVIRMFDIQFYESPIPPRAAGGRMTTLAACYTNRTTGFCGAHSNRRPTSATGNTQKAELRFNGCGPATRGTAPGAGEAWKRGLGFHLAPVTKRCTRALRWLAHSDVISGLHS